MNLPILLAVTLFLLFEFVFLFVLLRALKQSKAVRGVDFSQMDRERREIAAMQFDFRSEVEAARAESKETLSKLQAIGLQVHAEWTEMTVKIDEVMANIEERSQGLSRLALQEINKKQLECRKILDNAERVQKKLEQSVESAKKMSSFFTSQKGVEDVLREIQMEKYQEARRQLIAGLDPGEISQSLGLSKAEVTLVSHSLGM